MTLNEFVLTCSKRGYSTKKEAEKWCKDHPKDEYTEDDCITVYRYYDQPYLGSGKCTMSGRYGFCKTTKHFLSDHDGNR